MTNQTQVYLRADGNSQTGLGHVHRLLALSEILNPLFSCKFIIKSPLKGLKDLILESCGDIFELNENISKEHEIEYISEFLTGKEIVVLDGYQFDTAYQMAIKKSAGKLVCIDDIFSTHFVSDIVINPAGGLNEEIYSKEPYTILFSGPRFAFLKSPFQLASQQTFERETKSLFICMGGADPENHTLSALKLSLTFSFESYYIVVGEAYLFKDQLMHEIKAQEKKINLLTNLKPQTLAEIMKLCPTAICSASGIAYEYMSIGGELYVQQTASNQKLLYNYLLREGLAFNSEEMRVSKERASNSQLKQREIFDGKSNKTILNIFNKLDLDLHIRIRKAQASDLLITFEWANDPELRRQSFSSAPISLASHTAWFNKKLNAPNAYLYIFEYKNLPIAQVRFDILEKEAIISYSIDKIFRGRGWGEPILAMAMKDFKQEYKESISIVGFVKHENEGSNKVFMRLKFTPYQAQEYPKAFKYVKS